MPEIVESIEDLLGDTYYAKDYACGWFALCTNTADRFLSHPILNQVPTCKRCSEKMENM